MSTSRRIFPALGLILGISLIISLSKDINVLFEARNRLYEKQIELARLEAQQQELAGDLEEVMSQEFVEREAREKLLMSKPDEVVVFLPEKSEESKKEDGAEEPDREMANWEKWVRLFI